MAFNNKIHLKTLHKRYLADTATPVTMYLKVRDHYKNPVLLESNDFAGVFRQYLIARNRQY